MADSGVSPKADQEPGVFRTLKQDIHRVLADMRRVGLKRSMSRTLTELQEFYFTTERRDRLASMGSVKRWLRVDNTDIGEVECLPDLNDNIPSVQAGQIGLDN